MQGFNPTPYACKCCIFFRISTSRLEWLGGKFTSKWTFELPEQVVTTKISQKWCMLVMSGQGPTICFRLNDVSVNSRQQVNVRLCQHWWRSKNVCYFPLFQNCGCTAECDDRLKWKLHTFVFHMEPLLSFRTIGALNSKTRRDRNLRITTTWYVKLWTDWPRSLSGESFPLSHCCGTNCSECAGLNTPIFPD